MIGEALRAQVETYAASTRGGNALFAAAEAGALTVDHVVLYLANVRAVVAHTPVHLARAREAARARGQGVLTAHFGRRLGEEEGHEQWAVTDLTVVTRRADAPRTNLLSSTRALLDFVERTIDEDPALYLAYILFAEYVTVLLGPDWLDMLERRCGIPRAAMSVVGNHAELDRDHVRAALDEIDELVGAPEKLPALRRVLEQSIDHFERFCEDVVTHDEHAEPIPRRSHAPAFA